MRGRLASARASATRCCWPPESWCGLARPPLAEAEILEQAAGFRPGVGAPQASAEPGRQQNVVEDGGPGQQRGPLEHYGAARHRAAHIRAIDPHRAGGRGGEPGEDLQQRRLADARAAEDADALAGLHREIDALEHRRGSVAVGDRSEGEMGA